MGHYDECYERDRKHKEQQRKREEDELVKRVMRIVPGIKTRGPALELIQLIKDISEHNFWSNF